MKKHIHQYAILFFSVLLLSCNGGREKTAEETAQATTTDNKAVVYDFTKDEIKAVEICKDAGGLGNFLVLKNDALDMMRNFDFFYKEDPTVYPVDALLNTYWLNPLEVSDIAQYLKDKGNNGIRIYMACSLTADEVTYKNRAYQNESTIFLFPTTKANPPYGDPNKSDNITDKNSTLHEKTYASKCAFIRSFAAAKPLIDKFDELYRHNPIMGEKEEKKLALSSSVWVDSCVIFTLDRMLKKYSGLLDGASILMGAYSKKNPKCPSMQYDTQSTALLVPTSRGGAHQPNWEIIDQYTRALMKAFNEPGGFNHGELCPQKCDGDIKK